MELPHQGIIRNYTSDCTQASKDSNHVSRPAGGETNGNPEAVRPSRIYR
ncbi:hypothetical protein E2C01_074476 [Portunus trituberculatus]|uniref:Uncharacterized protein n=1 Tax=Portunus trituberculatus TaxID=210409 RepID=A0A5B7IDL2_PORTR|nr:hypothetical protein [Portunus trituberculatus]